MWFQRVKILSWNGNINTANFCDAPRLTDFTEGLGARWRTLACECRAAELWAKHSRTRQSINSESLGASELRMASAEAGGRRPGVPSA